MLSHPLPPGRGFPALLKQFLTLVVNALYLLFRLWSYWQSPYTICNKSKRTVLSPCSTSRHSLESYTIESRETASCSPVKVSR